MSSTFTLSFCVGLINISFIFALLQERLKHCPIVIPFEERTPPDDGQPQETFTSAGISSAAGVKTSACNSRTAACNHSSRLGFFSLVICSSLSFLACLHQIAAASRAMTPPTRGFRLIPINLISPIIKPITSREI